MKLRIKELCKEKGITMADLAEALKVTPSALSQSISKNPNLDRLQSVAEALGVHITELFDSPKNETIGLIRHKGKSYDINSIADIERALIQIKN